MGTTLQVIENSATFEDFWILYPRRVAKKDALKAWSKLTAEQHIQAVTACVAWRRIWADKELEFIAHPATWLNGWRFEDELPIASKVSHAAHVTAVLPVESAKTEMPDHVRAVIAKLRGK